MNLTFMMGGRVGEQRAGSLTGSLRRGQGETVVEEAQRVKTGTMSVRYCGNRDSRRKLVENQDLWQSGKRILLPLFDIYNSKNMEHS